METSSQLYSTNTSNNTMGEAMTSSTTPSGVAGNVSGNRRIRDMENLSLEISKYPRDLLQRFLGTNKSSRNRDDDVGIEHDDVGGVNLGLGLSLGGKFGVDKSHKGLARSSSIIGTMPLIKNEETIAPPPPPRVGPQSLVRTCSLPVESEEEWRKRKEVQCLRRMEAKRRRLEKQRVLKESGGGDGEDKGVETLNVKGRLEKEQQCLGISGNKSFGNPFGSSSTPPMNVKKRTTFGSLQGFLALAQAQAQQGGSRELHGGGSSGAFDLESKTQQGSSRCGEERCPTSIHPLQGTGTQESGTKGDNTPQGPTREAEMTSSKQPASTESQRRESTLGTEDMPCVFTIGERKVEGVLYRYGKGEEAQIMCVCHGYFYSPAGFVKHAGGRDVEHPLRHIVVSPTTCPYQ